MKTNKQNKAKVQMDSFENNLMVYKFSWALVSLKEIKKLMDEKNGIYRLEIISHFSKTVSDGRENTSL